MREVCGVVMTRSSRQVPDARISSSCFRISCNAVFMVFVWNFWISKLGGVWGIYELLPAFVISCIVIVVVSLLTKKPSAQIEEEFDAVSKKA